MPSESCPICGEEADADEIDPHGHFALDDEPDGYEDVVHLLIVGSRKDTTACGEDPELSSDGASTNEGDVNCSQCRAVM